MVPWCVIVLIATREDPCYAEVKLQEAENQNDWRELISGGLRRQRIIPPRGAMTGWGLPLNTPRALWITRRLAVWCGHEAVLHVLCHLARVLG